MMAVGDFSALVKLLTIIALRELEQERKQAAGSMSSATPADVADVRVAFNNAMDVGEQEMREWRTKVDTTED